MRGRLAWGERNDSVGALTKVKWLADKGNAMDVDLVALSKALTQKAGPRSSIPAGYTYLGQMIAHDLVAPRTSPSLRTFAAKLNLDSIYASSNSNGFPEVDKDREWDLPRNPEGIANIPEPRNDENIIVAQLHRVWQRVHENIVRHGASQEQARADVVRLFQAVVIDDYLQRILQPHVFQAYFRRGERHLGFADDKVPEVFSHAAFRFGHSMVRRAYTLNSEAHGITLSRLFLAGKVIPDEFKISWSEFFKIDPERDPQNAMGIDTSITDLMTGVPAANSMVQDVVLRNLQAGVGLPTGLEYVTGLLNGLSVGSEYYPKVDPALHLYRAVDDSVQVLGLSGDKLPLYPYILLESELQGQRARLGVLGSLIVGETIQNAIRTASPSVFQGGVYRFTLVLKELSQACRTLLATTRNGNSAMPESIGMPAIISIANPM